MRHLHGGVPYWSPYDLLGLFLAYMGPAPENARKRNFYLPLTAVYGRWCRQIAGHWTTPNAGVGALPIVFQCTWRAVPGRRDFFLGAALAGYKWNVLATGTWETVLKRARFDLVREAAEGRGFNFDTSPRINRNAGTRFGNCAETYPFLNILTYVLYVPFFLSFFFLAFFSSSVPSPSPANANSLIVMTYLVTVERAEGRETISGSH
jgi:hypothetical protein